MEATRHQGSCCVFLVQISQPVVMAGLVAASMSTKLFNHLHVHIVRNDRKETADELRATEAAGLICHTSSLKSSTPLFAEKCC